MTSTSSPTAPVIIALARVTAHVPDYSRSVPPEYDVDDRIVQGQLATTAVPPWTPFEVATEAEAARLLTIHEGVRIPADTADAVAWLRQHATELRIPSSTTIGDLVRLGGVR